jgi:hypothetical protein
MGIADNTYGTVSRVQELVGDVVSGRVFSTATVPTLAQVEDFLDRVADELNGYLKTNGYTVPVVEGTDPEAFGILRFANSAGASSFVLAALPAEASGGFGPGASTDDQTVNSRKQFLWSQVNRSIKMIETFKIPAARTTRKFARMRSGSYKDDNLNEKLPVFRRDIMDYPGSRSLTK